MDILITGTTVGGIGYETAKRLLKDGHRVFIVCRNKQKTDETAKALSVFGRIEKAGDEMDLDDLDSVRRFVAGFKPISLNCLINNAGIMGIPDLQFTKQGVERHVGVNYLSHYLLTRLLLDRLTEGAKRSGAPSRIVNVSSDAHLWAKDIHLQTSFAGLTPYDASKQYAISKLLQLWDTADINRRFAAQSQQPAVISFALHPGVVDTNLSREMPADAVAGLRKMSEDDPRWKLITPMEGAQTTLFCATASLAELQCFPPLKTHETQVQYYRDAKRAEKLTRTVKEAQKVDELVKLSEEFCARSAPVVARL